MEDKLKLAVFIDFDNIEIGVKSTLHREFDVAAVLDALKERGEIVTCIAYANWGRQESATRAMTEHAVQMVQRDPSPRGDKNGADINLALDALEMAFTHDHINAFAIVSGDSDFMALLNKLKQYDKRVFVLGGKAFTSTILQKNCHEFISYESLLDEPKPAPATPTAGRPSTRRPTAATATAAAAAWTAGAQASGAAGSGPGHAAGGARLASPGTPQRAPAAWTAEIHHAAARFRLQRESLRVGLFYGFRGEAAKGQLRPRHRRRRPLHDQAHWRGGSREVHRAAGSGPASLARCAGDAPHGGGRGRSIRRARRVGEAGTPRLRLEAVRLPGIQRVAELRAG